MAAEVYCLLALNSWHESDGRGGMADATYFTNIGPEKGPILWRDHHGAIGVLSAPDNHMPIGMALENRWDDQGRQLYRLIVRKVELPGLSVVIDRQFVPATGTR
jgi:hypothetical protein